MTRRALGWRQPRRGEEISPVRKHWETDSGFLSVIPSGVPRVLYFAREPRARDVVEGSAVCHENHSARTL